MKTNKTNKIFTLVFIVLAVFALGYYINASTQTKDNSSNQGGMDKQTSEIIFSGNLIYAKFNQDSTDIYKIDLKTNQEKKIFTDRDENNKIKSIGNLTYNNKILLLMMPKDQEFIGNLYLVNSDSSGSKEKIADNFASTSRPIISPDGQKIAYTLFSNAEADYGFRLIVANKDNTSKREIVRDAANLKIFSWNPESDKLCFSKGDNQKQTEIFIIDLEDNQQSSWEKIDGQVYSLDWGKNEQFVLSIGPRGESLNQVEIYSYINHKPNKLTKNDFYDDFPHISANNNIAYASIVYQGDQPTIYLPGKINIMAISGANSKELTEGNYLIGFVE